MTSSVSLLALGPDTSALVVVKHESPSVGRSGDQIALSSSRNFCGWETPNGTFPKGVLEFHSNFLVLVATIRVNGVNVYAWMGWMSEAFARDHQVNMWMDKATLPVAGKPRERRGNQSDGVRVRFRVRFQAVKVPIFGGFPVENPTKKANRLKGLLRAIPLSEYGSEGFRVLLRGLSEYGSVACLLERPTRETRAEQYSDTVLISEPFAREWRKVSDGRLHFTFPGFKKELY